MDLEEDLVPHFREDACVAIHGLIADALYRCSRQSDATQIAVRIWTLPPTTLSLSPIFIFSVAHSGPGIKASEFRNCFPQFTKSCYSTPSTQCGLRWGGVVRILTADTGEKSLCHYEILVRSDNGSEIVQLPHAEVDTEFVSGVVSEIIVTGCVHELVDFARSICDKTPMLMLKNVTLDFFLQSTFIDDIGHHVKGLRMCDGNTSLEIFSAEEMLCFGAIQYLSCCRCGFPEGSPADLRFRETVQVGVGHAGSTDAKWRLDACIALIDVTMADEIFDTIDSRTSVVIYFEDGCYTPTPESVLKGLGRVEWTKFGLQVKEFQMRRIATDVAECIANMITSSTNDTFRQECASILQLPIHSLDEVESFMRSRMFDIIQQHDGCTKRTRTGKTIEHFTLEPELTEADEGFLFYDHEDQEFV
ncbi:type 2 DNA topoisomerase 6 subunit B-like isoform X2 [Physcomitrium patens]|uniref:type 2 DNA topoisomerase 6 subunit B-like isoform X2 n=1 Tax=Physcomitrium patens TaxID=3218 RepID=UPI003CCE0ADB